MNMREFWIDDPSQSDPVSFMRWAKWRIGTWMESKGRHLQYIALDQCQMCGTYRDGKPHDDCDEIPF
jgi:hypothetical protein